MPLWNLKEIMKVMSSLIKGAAHLDHYYHIKQFIMQINQEYTSSSSLEPLAENSFMLQLKYNEHFSSFYYYVKRDCPQTCKFKAEEDECPHSVLSSDVKPVRQGK